MPISKSIKWFLDAIPRTPKKAGLLMRIYYRWQESFTPAGRSAAALMFLSMVLGLVPGFWAAWIFCGLDFLLFLTLVPSLFLTSKKNKFQVESIDVSAVFEGDVATVNASVSPSDRVDSASLGAFRMDPSLVCEENPPVLCQGQIQLNCSIKTKVRGAFKINKVGIAVPEVMGMLRAVQKIGELELLVFPRPVKILEFPFLTAGASGLVFAPLLMPSLTRGLDFVGVREYREGDSLRDLHHKAFARYGRPFTKEFETERGAGAVLVLDVRAKTWQEKSQVENLIRLAAGVGLWLMERGALGRFFVGDEEVSLVQADGGLSFLSALARIPRASLSPAKKGREGWNPAARPMCPVLRLGLNPLDSSLIHKHIVLDATKTQKNTDDILYIKPCVGEVSL